MKKLFALFVLFVVPIFAQTGNSNSVTVTVVAPPSWTITVAPLNYYQNSAATMTITVTAGPVANTCTAKWDSTNLPLTFPTSLSPDPVAITAAVSAAMTAATGAHTVVITCPFPTLSILSPVTLPNASVGQAYSANLQSLSQLNGGIPPYTWALASGSLPAGLSLSANGIVTGTPSGAGSFNFNFKVTDSSGL